MPKKIDSDFAILDVKKGRATLAKRFTGKNFGARIPVTVHGFITGQHSRDDGTSIEFTIEVTSAKELSR